MFLLVLSESVWQYSYHIVYHISKYVFEMFLSILFPLLLDNKSAPWDISSTKHVASGMCPHIQCLQTLLLLERIWIFSKDVWFHHFLRKIGPGLRKEHISVEGMFINQWLRTHGAVISHSDTTKHGQGSCTNVLNSWDISYIKTLAWENI